MQFLSEKLYVLAGKIDFTRLPGGNAFTGDAYNQFLNTTLWQDPTNFALIPYTALAAGVGMMPTEWFDAATFVIDSHSRPTRTGFDTAFHSPNGMTLLQAFAFHIKPFGLPGTQRFNFAWSSRNRIDLADTGRLLLSGAAAPSFGRCRATSSHPAGSCPGPGESRPDSC